MRFANRRQAGILLADRLEASHWHDPIVLGMVRGGIEVAFPIAARLGAPLDVAVVRKIGAPNYPEFGIGAVTPDGTVFYDGESLRMLGLTEEDLEPVRRAEQAEARRRLETYREGRPAPDLSGRDVIAVDDGVATGVTARAAVRDLRAAQPSRLVLAVPLCARSAERALRAEDIEVFCLHMPEDLGAIGLWYEEFAQLSDLDVLTYLHRARERAMHGDSGREGFGSSGRG